MITSSGLTAFHLSNVGKILFRRHYIKNGHKKGPPHTFLVHSGLKGSLGFYFITTKLKTSSKNNYRLGRYSISSAVSLP